MQKWEYMTYHWDHRVEMDEELNELGQDGWEVVAGSGAGGGATRIRMFFVLKRPC